MIRLSALLTATVLLSACSSPTGPSTPTAPPVSHTLATTLAGSWAGFTLASNGNRGSLRAVLSSRDGSTIAGTVQYQNGSKTVTDDATVSGSLGGTITVSWSTSCPVTATGSLYQGDTLLAGNYVSCAGSGSFTLVKLQP